jgi:hypothetical protein
VVMPLNDTDIYLGQKQQILCGNFSKKFRGKIRFAAEERANKTIPLPTFCIIFLRKKKHFPPNFFVTFALKFRRKRFFAEKSSEKSTPVVSPWAAIYNASGVKIYNAMNSIVRFENKHIIFYFQKALAYYIQRWRCYCKFRSSRIGSRSQSYVF